MKLKFVKNLKVEKKLKWNIRRKINANELIIEKGRLHQSDEVGYLFVPANILNIIKP